MVLLEKKNPDERVVGLRDPGKPRVKCQIIKKGDLFKMKNVSFF